jgi:hypothetical protein
MRLTIPEAQRKEEAAARVDAVAKKHYGEFAILNLL